MGRRSAIRVGQPNAVRRSTHRWLVAIVGTVAMMALLAALVPASVSADASTGSITGTVYGPDGTPAVGLLVSAQRFPDTSVYESTNTGADGTYTLSGLAPGTYLMAVRDSYGVLPSGYVSGAGLTPLGPLASVVTVGWTSTQVSVHIPAGHTISGTVTAGGSPLPGIYLYVCGALDGGLAATQVVYCGHVTTAADGTYSVAVLPGAYTVASYDGTDTYPYTFYSATGATLSGAAATVLSVTSADIGGVDVALAAAPSYGGAIGGTVADDTASPLSGINVSACPTAAPASCYSATTGADGTYTVNSLPPGSYTVTFADPTNAHAAGFYGPVGFAATLAGAAPVAVVASVVSGIAVQLPVGYLVQGTVTGPAGAPLAGIVVAPCASPACAALAPNTGADGSYSLDLAPGSYVFHFTEWSGTDLSGYYSTAGLANAAHATPVTVGAANLTGLNVVLHGITASIGAGITKKGPFGSGHTIVTRNHGYVTLRVAVGKAFAGSSVQFQVAKRGTTGAWTAYETLTSRAVGADGYAYYSVRPVGWMSFRAGVRDPVVSAEQIAGGLGDVVVFSGAVVTRGL